jgi:hypothetical protein
MKNRTTPWTTALLGAAALFAGCDDSGSSEEGAGTEAQGEESSGAESSGAESSGAESSGAESSGEESTGEESAEAPETYTFASRFDAESSVAYTGQTHRLLLIDAFDRTVEGLTASIDQGTYTPSPGDVEALLNFYLDFDGEVSAEVPIGKSVEPAPLQAVWGDTGSGAFLVEKIAGNDEVGQHADWATDFLGWQQDGVTTPESLVRAWVSELDALAAARAAGEAELSPAGEAISEVYITADGLHLKELLEKFLYVSIAYSQSIDDYLDNDVEGKGILSSNAAAEEGKNYTALEHAWDEAFGYFGAARDFGDYSDEEIAAAGGRADYANGAHDSNGDGKIDFGTEFNFGATAGYAAKRDLGSAESAPTDFTAEIWADFIAGRALITRAAGELSQADATALEGIRDRLIGNWEKVLAANVVHYINATLGEMALAGTASYSFEEHTKVWAEMKAFALGLQFNRLSALSKTQHAELHQLLGQRPVVGTGAEADAYADDLRQARALLGTALGFDSANLGDADGNGGW